MAEYCFFTSRNPYWSRQTQPGDNAIEVRAGWCAAASAIWCSNILRKNMNPANSNPDKALAGILQVKYRCDPAGGGQDLLHLLGYVDLQGEIHDNLYLNGALERMTSYPGVYHFSNAGHSMACDTRAGHFYFYDIEEGLFGYGGADEWKDGIRRRYQSPKREWTVAKCS